MSPRDQLSPALPGAATGRSYALPLPLLDPQGGELGGLMLEYFGKSHFGGKKYLNGGDCADKLDSADIVVNISRSDGLESNALAIAIKVCRGVVFFFSF